MLNEIGKKVLGIDMKWDTKPLADKRVAVPEDFDPKTLMLVFEEITPDFDEKNVKVGENYVTMKGFVHQFEAAPCLSSSKWSG